MVSDLLDSARLDQGLFTLDRRPTDLVAMASEIGAAMASTPERIMVTASTRPVGASVDPDRLRSALENLLANALNHSPPTLPVVLRVEEEQRNDGTWAVITVTDQGPGIPAESQHHLFERFGRGSSSTGLGLGLYMARRIAEAHGGTLCLDTSYEAGARFTLALPEDPVSLDGPPRHS
jgi:signal transduction histidine kinase